MKQEMQRIEQSIASIAEKALILNGCTGIKNATEGESEIEFVKVNSS